jgi:hypothetical protein
VLLREIGAIYALTSAQLGVEAGLTPRLRAAAGRAVGQPLWPDQPDGSSPCRR